MRKNNILSGLKDFWPDEYKKYQYVTNLIKEISLTYGYHLIETPFIEKDELFKEYEDLRLHYSAKNGEEISFRANGYIPLLRVISDSKMYLDPNLPLKFSYYGHFYKLQSHYDQGKRQDNYLYGFESFANKSIYDEIELLILSTRALQFIGLENVRFRIKMIERQTDKKVFFKMLSDFKIDFIEDETLSNKNNKYSHYQYLIEVKKGKKHYLVGEGGGHIDLVKRFSRLDLNSFGFTLDIFVITDLLESLRLLPLMKDESDFYLVSKNKDDGISTLFVATILRDLGLKVEVDYLSPPIEEVTKLAINKGIVYLIVVSDKFISNEEIEVYNLLNNEKSIYKLDDYITKLEEYFDEHEHHEHDESKGE